MNKKGMTLIELLVYMAIAALLLAPVVMLMQNSSKNMARDAITTDLHISGSDILNIMYEDIRNTGFKLEDAAGSKINRLNVTYMDKTVDPPTSTDTTWSGDSSSFTPANGVGALDSLTIRKGRMSRPTNTNPNSVWEGCDTVSYFVSGDTLIRTHGKYNGAGGGPYAIDNSNPTPRTAIARNVEALQFQYSENMAVWADAPIANKTAVKYIKIAVVTVDRKKLSPVKTFTPVEIPAGTGTYTHTVTDLTEQQWLREISEIIVPIPNNGLFP